MAGPNYYVYEDGDDKISEPYLEFEEANKEAQIECEKEPGACFLVLQEVCNWTMKPVKEVPETKPINRGKS